MRARISSGFLWCTVLLGLAAAACGGDDGYGPPPGGGGDDDEDPDAMVNPDMPDASVDAPDADPTAGDGVGPVITQVSPLPGALVSGVMTLEVQIVDADGVDQDSVVATFGSGGHVIEMTASGTDRYRGTYDTLELAGLVFPPIIVRARDEAGNQSQLGFEVTLDNQGPIAELDPPRIRDAFVDDDSLRCTASYDPVGSDAVDDGESIPQLSELRARVVDRSNLGYQVSGVFVPYAGVASVRLWILDDSATPLVVSTDEDEDCEAINPDLVPTTVPSASNEAAVIDLVATTPTGEASFTISPGDAYTGTNLGCTAPANDNETNPVCLSSPATRIAATELGEPMIYAIPPAEGLTCMGWGFDALAANITDGWACVAIETVDGVGNSQVSPPLRVCINSHRDPDDPVGPTDPCGVFGTIADEGMRPDCTGTVLDGVVTTTACTPEVRFHPGAAGDYEIVRTDFQ